MLIQSTKDLKPGRAKVLIYADAKTGKTTLLGTLPEKKTLIISAESGLLTIRKKAFDFIDISVDDNGKQIPAHLRPARLAQVYKYLLTPEAMEKYDLVALDSLTEVSDCVLEELKIEDEKKDKPDPRGVWGEYLRRMMRLAKAFRDLQHYGVVVVCQGETEKDELTGLRYSAPMLYGQSQDKIIYVFDEIYHLGIEVKGGKNVRVLRTTKAPNVKAGSRLDIPAVIENPNLTQILELVEKAPIKDEKIEPSVSPQKVLETALAKPVGEIATEKKESK